MRALTLPRQSDAAFRDAGHTFRVQEPRAVPFGERADRVIREAAAIRTELLPTVDDPTEDGP